MNTKIEKIIFFKRKINKFILYYIIVIISKACSNSVNTNEFSKELNENIIYFDNINNSNIKQIQSITKYYPLTIKIFQDADLINKEVNKLTEIIKDLNINNYESYVFRKKISKLYSKANEIYNLIENTNDIYLLDELKIEIDAIEDSLTFINKFSSENQSINKTRLVLLELKIKRNLHSLINNLKIITEPDGIIVNKIMANVDLEKNCLNVGDTLKGEVYPIGYNEDINIIVHFGKPNWELFDKNNGFLIYKSNNEFKLPIIENKKFKSEKGKVSFEIPILKKGNNYIEGVI